MSKTSGNGGNILFNSGDLPPRRLDQSVTIDHVDLIGDGDCDVVDDGDAAQP